jgi:hypothetical protein
MCRAFTFEAGGWAERPSPPRNHTNVIFPHKNEGKNQSKTNVHNDSKNKILTNKAASDPWGLRVGIKTDCVTIPSVAYVLFCDAISRLYSFELGLLMKWEILESRPSCFDRGSVVKFDWRSRGKPRKFSVMTADCSAEVRTEHLPNVCLEPYRFTNLPGSPLQNACFDRYKISLTCCTLPSITLAYYERIFVLSSVCLTEV